MTKIAERPAGPEIVLVVCLGIACEAGFAVNPDGFEQSYAHFQPGVPTPLAKHYADFLIAQDPTRFEIVKTEKKEADKSQQQTGEKTAKKKPGRKPKTDAATTAQK